MLMEYKGDVTVKIDGLAASAASVIAMAGTTIGMSPVSMLMIHNPSTIAIGEADEMLKAKALLDEVKKSIINAYEIKTGLTRKELSKMMDAETWMNCHKAVELGFADMVMFGEHSSVTDGLMFSRQAVAASLIDKLKSKKEIGTPIKSLKGRLNLLNGGNFND